MLFENIRILPLELRNNVTGQVKVVTYGEVVDLPEQVGRLYPNYLRPVAKTEEIKIEDISTEIESEFNMDSIYGKTERKQIVEDDLDKVIPDVVKEKKAGRPKKYEDGMTPADKRYIQRQNKKKKDLEIKNFKF